MKRYPLALLFFLWPVFHTHAVLLGYWDLNETGGPISDQAGPPFTNSSNGLGAGDYSQPSVPAGVRGSINLSATQAAALGTAINIPFNNSFFMGSPVGSDLNLTSGFTTMAWANPSSVVGNHMIFATGGGGGNGWKYGINGNRLRFTSNGIVDFTVPAGTHAVVPNEWFHYAITVSPTSDLEFFVNGDSVFAGSIAGINPSTAVSMLLGNNGQGPPGSSFNENWNGLLDEVKIFNNVLTQQQIRAQALGPAVVGGVPEPSSVVLMATVLGVVGWVRRRRCSPKLG